MYIGQSFNSGTNVDNGLHGATITAVPEPASLMMLAAGAAGIAVIRRRHRPAHR